MAELINTGQVSAEALLEIAIQRAEAVDGQLNALTHPLYEHAREQLAGGTTGPLAGVPMLVKDLFQEIAGAPHYRGSQALLEADIRATEDAVLVRRWKAAGLVPFGRTNTPEFGVKSITEPEAFGPSRNPWNLKHTPGGSSGGSAAMVAAGVVPVAGGNDGGGSIRIPAACCGLFGLKPGRGRTPWGPTLSELMHGMVTNHVLTRSVRDSALILDLTHGPEPGSLFHIAPPKRSYLEAARTPPGKLVVGFSTTSPLGTPVASEAIQAVEDAATLLDDLGHEVEEAQPAMEMKQMCMDWLYIWFGQCAAIIEETKLETGADRTGFESDTLAMAAVGRALTVEKYEHCLSQAQAYMLALDSFLDRYDFWLTPTLAQPPSVIGEHKTPAWLEKLIRASLRIGMAKIIVKSGQIERVALQHFAATPFTQLANMTGVPAMSVPLYWCDNGLPLGVQFVGGHGDEGKLLSLAGQLEQARPWFDKLPSLGTAG
ncbi:amidase [Alkalilimnicola ehrlichii]|nr:amidase [Alkalilimnicola ehrlichii]